MKLIIGGSYSYISPLKEENYFYCLPKILD